jgi:hypothetical protein
MGGQDGFSRDLLDYNTESNNFMIGGKYFNDEKFEIGVDLSLMDASASLAPFDLSADDYVAITPPMSYDFSNTHTYSDLDVSRIDAEAWAKIWINPKMWLRLRYHFVDYTDDAPYLYDTSGTFQYASAAFGFFF